MNAIMIFMPSIIAVAMLILIFCLCAAIGAVRRRYLFKVVRMRNREAKAYQNYLEDVAYLKSLNQKKLADSYFHEAYDEI